MIPLCGFNFHLPYHYTLEYTNDMTLYTLLAGTSKKKMKRLETSSKSKCENYMKALKATSSCKYKWFEIREALEDEEFKLHKSQNQWTNYNTGLTPRVPR